MKKIFAITFASCLIQVASAQPENTENVSINTGNVPRAKVEVNGVAPGGATSAIFGTDGAGISFQRNWPTIGFNQYRDNILPGSQGKYMANGFAAIQYFDINTGTLAFDMFPSGTAGTSTPAGARALTILSNGNVGIRTGASNATLTVARGDGIDGTAVFTGTQHWSHFNYSTGEHTYIRAGNDNSNVYINKIPSGDVYIGNSNSRIIINSPPTTPHYTIDLLQPANVHSLSIRDAYGYSWHQQVRHVNVSGQGDGNMLEFYYGNMESKGRFQYWDGLYATFSDSRLKQNVESISPVLDKLNKLNPVSYVSLNENPNELRTIGFIAQEVKKIFPQFVRVINDKSRSGEPVVELNTISYSVFGVVAIKALQEQWQEIKALEEESAVLIRRLDELDKKLANIKD